MKRPIPTMLTNSELIRQVAVSKDSTDYERELARRLDETVEAGNRMAGVLRQHDLFDRNMLMERVH